MKKKIWSARIKKRYLLVNYIFSIYIAISDEMTITAIPKEFIMKKIIISPQIAITFIYSLFNHCLEWNDHCGRLAKGSDYYETKIIVSFQTAIILLYSLFVFIFFSIIFPLKQECLIDTPLKQHIASYCCGIIV